MARNNPAELGQDERLDQIRELLLSYLGKMDIVKPGPKTIFRTENSKVDLETKVWHHHHKIEATWYHCRNVRHLTATVREDLTKMLRSRIGRPVGSASEFRLAVQDRRILYEVDAFFAALQSALDFLASVVSRYIRGKDADEFDKLLKFLCGSPHPVAALVNEAWADWVEGSIRYRDHLIHRGVLPTPTGVHVRVTRSEASDPAIKKLAKLVQGEQGRPIVFPLPMKPDPRIRLTRQDLLGLNELELPMGIIETSTTVTLSSEENEKGPKVRVSLRRSIGSVSVDATSEQLLGKQSIHVRSVRYGLAPGYVEAEKLCQDLYEKLTDLSLKIFGQLTKAGFAHIA